ncbi:helix-turn-helix domain-containing protein, partial [Vibrio parahaemolyticus]
ELGVYQATVNRYEKGRSPNLKTCWQIINALCSLGAKCKFQDVFPDNTAPKKTA